MGASQVTSQPDDDGCTEDKTSSEGSRSYLVLGVDDELPERLEDDGVEEGEVVEATLPAQHELKEIEQL